MGSHRSFASRSYLEFSKHYSNLQTGGNDTQRAFLLSRTVSDSASMAIESAADGGNVRWLGCSTDWKGIPIA